MRHLLLAASGPIAMRLGGALLSDDSLALDVVTDGRLLLDRVNQAPNFYHLAIVSLDLPEIDGAACLAVLRRLHGRMPILALGGPDALMAADAGALGLRPADILPSSVDAGTFAARIRAALDGPSPPSNA